MPKWLQGMVAPTLMLWLCAVASAAIPDSGELSNRADLAAGVALPLIVASWVMADAHKRGRRLCYDYDAFVFFAWPIVVPVYLFQTRGARAFLTLLCFAGIWIVAWIVAMLAASLASMMRDSVAF